MRYFGERDDGEGKDDRGTVYQNRTERHLLIEEIRYDIAGQGQFFFFSRELSLRVLLLFSSGYSNKGISNFDYSTVPFSFCSNSGLHRIPKFHQLVFPYISVGNKISFRMISSRSSQNSQIVGRYQKWYTQS